jgi:predicted metal-dependent hydrolase
MPNYHEKYLEGLRLFNDEEFFDSHDVLEELWQETAGEEKKFYQGLIQIAISLFHFGNGNLGGAKKLYGTSRKYLDAYRPTYLGLDVDKLLTAHAACFAELLASTEAYPSHIELRDELVPKIELPLAPTGGEGAGG